MPGQGADALGGIGLCFPFVIMVTAFTNLYGQGGAPLTAMARGRRDLKEAREVMNTAFMLLSATSLLLLAAFEHLRDYDGPVPGATPVNCGNYILHDLAMAKWEAARFVEVLKAKPCFAYPVAARPVTERGAVFYDS